MVSSKNLEKFLPRFCGSFKDISCDSWLISDIAPGFFFLRNCIKTIGGTLERISQGIIIEIYIWRIIAWENTWENFFLLNFPEKVVPRNIFPRNFWKYSRRNLYWCSEISSGKRLQKSLKKSGGIHSRNSYKIIEGFSTQNFWSLSLRIQKRKPKEMFWRTPTKWHFWRKFWMNSWQNCKTLCRYYSWKKRVPFAGIIHGRIE